MITRTGWMTLCLFLAAGPAVCQSYELAIDVPDEVGNQALTPSDFVQRTGPIYGVAGSIPSGEVNALHRDGSKWIFSPAYPTDLGGATYEPRDVVSQESGTYSLVLDGSSLGIPLNASVDAYFEDGDAIVSFDVPLTLSGKDFMPNDLVRWNGVDFSMYLDGSSLGIPDSTNVIAASRDGEKTVMAFDVPTTLGALDLSLGQIVSYDGVSVAIWSSDPGWTSHVAMTGLHADTPAGVGVVPDGAGGTLPLTLTKADESVLLDWDPSCSAFDGDYSVYEGKIGGVFDEHLPATCSTGGATQALVVPENAISYFLVVPHDSVAEGAYGDASSGAARPASSSPCFPQSAPVCP